MRQGRIPDLTGRVALVTGGSRGIGAATATALAGAGARVAILYRSDADAAVRVVDEIRGMGEDALAVRGDVADETEVARAFDQVRGTFGSVEVLITNAGIHRGGRTERLAVDDFRAVIDTNLLGAFLCCRAALPDMRRASWGRIVTVGSVVGLVGFPGDVAYASSKAALGGLTRALAVECATDGITVNLVAPGFVETDMTRGLSDAARARIEDSIPMRRQGRGEEIAEMIVAVAASPYTTGSTLVVDGGHVIA